MQTAPRSLRLHIGIFGRTNTGKSSLLNAMTHQDVAITSALPGTTTDPVEKAMELLPIGPVLFIDTAGIDDPAALGPQRVERTLKAIDRTDVALIVTEAGGWGVFEQELLERLRSRSIPALVVFNKKDLALPRKEETGPLEALEVPWVAVQSTGGGWETTAAVKEKLLALMPDDWVNERPIAADLVHHGETVLLVIPLDKESPRGRLIMPEQQTIRELLDHQVRICIVNEHQVRESIEDMRLPPSLVVTDSQAFEPVFQAVPASIPVTSFSILFARYKGDLGELAAGARALATLKPGDRILISEACTHHPIGEDIGRVKIPALLRRRFGQEILVDVVSGRDLPPDLSQYHVVIHCGACVFSRREMLSTLLFCHERQVPITNYGMAIAFLNGSLERALRPFLPCLESS